MASQRASGGQRRSAGFSAVCAVTIVLAALGVLGSLWELGGIVFQARLSSAFMPRMSAPGFIKMQRDLQRAMLEASLPMARGVVAAIRLMVEGVLVFAAVRTLQLRASARRLLLAVLTAAAGVELAALAVTLLVQIRMYSALQDFLEHWMPATAVAVPAKFRSMFRIAMSAGAVLGLAWAIVWGTVKIGFYVFARIYLRRPAAAALFEAPAATSDSPLATQD